MSLSGVCAALCAAGLALTVSAAFAADGAAPVKVLCFGDSITEGYLLEDPPTQCYPAALQRLIDAEQGKGRFAVVNAGISGQDTRQALKRVDKLLADERPDWVLMKYGTNDLWSGRNMSLDDTRANLTLLVSKIKASGARLIMSTIIPVSGLDDKVAARNEVIKAVAAEAGVPTIDLNAVYEKALAEAGGRDKPATWLKYYCPEEDFVHPNALGAELIAREWLAALAKEMAPAAK